MATLLDHSLNGVKESTYKTYVAPTKAVEMMASSTLDWTKNVMQGESLRVGSLVDRSGRRVVPTAQGGGDTPFEVASKGMSWIWEACMGTGVATLVSGTTYQHLFTLGALSSYTLQEGIVEVGGTADPYSWLGCMVDSWELSWDNGGLVSLKVTWDVGDITTAQALATITYPAAPVNLYHFANSSMGNGAITAPTTTALASAAGTQTNIRSGSIKVSNNLAQRFNAGGGGRKAKPIAGKRSITGSLEVEYDATTYRDLVLNDGAFTLLAQWTAGALSSGNETLQLVCSELKADGTLPKPSANGDVVVQSINFTLLDNLTAAQPMWVVLRTADSTI